MQLAILSPTVPVNKKYVWTRDIIGLDICVQIMNKDLFLHMVCMQYKHELHFHDPERENPNYCIFFILVLAPSKN